MTTQAIVCDACAAQVPAGRLSCPSCGELLASVAGGRRGSHNGTSSTATPATVYAVLAAGATKPEDLAADGTGDTVTDDGVDAISDASAADPIDATTAPSAAVAAAAASWAVAGPAPVTTAAPAPPPVPTWPSTAPGAYVPPPPAPVGTSAAPARAWGGHAAPPAAGPATPDVPAGPASDRPSTKARSGSIDGVRVDEFVGWVSVAGSALGAVGFLLPWSSTVIGSTGGGYFDRWGLGTPGHVVVALGLLVVLVLALVRNPIPVWVRVGLPGLGLGSLLVGLVWPYVVGPLGSGPGVLIVVAGALLLGVAGVVALAADRHVEAERVV